jgi:hypothetical protein
MLESGVPSRVLMLPCVRVMALGNTDIADDPTSPLSVREYDVAPSSAPLFLVGEAWAELHLRDLELAGLRRNELVVGQDATVAPLPEGRVLSSAALDPDFAARDLVAALRVYSYSDARAILAGYARAAYESADHRLPGFTDAVLDRLGVDVPRPRPHRLPLDIPRLFRGLGVVLVNEGRGLALRTCHADGSNPWKREPAVPFLVLLGLFVVGVDCRDLFARDMVAPDASKQPHLYRVLWPDSRIGRDVEASVERLRGVAQGIELGVGLAQVLRNSELPEPIDFNHALFWVRRVLVNAETPQSLQLGDVLIEVAWHCARLILHSGGTVIDAEPYLQKAVICTEYLARGTEDDEARFVRLGHELRGLSWTPWRFTSSQDACRLGVVNSLLLTERAFAEKSLAAQEAGRPGPLRSAALRGHRLARRTLYDIYAAAACADPEVAAPAFVFLRVTIKNYAIHLGTLWQMANLEERATGASAWLTFFGSPSNPSLLARELGWIMDGYQTAAQEGYSLDVARSLLRDAPVPLASAG